MSHSSLASIPKGNGGGGEIVKERFTKSFRKLRAARGTDYDVKKK